MTPAADTPLAEAIRDVDGLGAQRHRKRAEPGTTDPGVQTAHIAKETET